MAKIDLDALSIEELAGLRDHATEKLAEKVAARRAELEADTAVVLVVAFPRRRDLRAVAEAQPAVFPDEACEVGLFVERDELPVLGRAANEQMGVRVPGVEMIDCNPVERRPEVLLHLRHQLSREGSERVEHSDGSPFSYERGCFDLQS